MEGHFNLLFYVLTSTHQNEQTSNFDNKFKIVS